MNNRQNVGIPAICQNNLISLDNDSVDLDYDANAIQSLLSNDDNRKTKKAKTDQYTQWMLCFAKPIKTLTSPIWNFGKLLNGDELNPNSGRKIGSN